MKFERVFENGNTFSGFERVRCKEIPLGVLKLLIQGPFLLRTLPLIRYFGGRSVDFGSKRFVVEEKQCRMYRKAERGKGIVLSQVTTQKKRV